MTVAPSPASLSPATDEIARLAVEIDDVTPRVARVVEVPIDIRLDDLHFVLQIAIGWQNGHPFEFRIGDKRLGLAGSRCRGDDSAPAEQATLRGYSHARRQLYVRLCVRRGLAAHGQPSCARARPSLACVIQALSAPKAAVRRPTSAARSATRPICAASRIPRASTTRTCSPSTRRISIPTRSMSRRCVKTWRTSRAISAASRAPRPHPSRLAPLAPQDDENRQ